MGAPLDIPITCPNCKANAWRRVFDQDVLWCSECGVSLSGREIRAHGDQLEALDDLYKRIEHEGTMT